MEGLVTGCCWDGLHGGCGGHPAQLWGWWNRFFIASGLKPIYGCRKMQMVLFGCWGADTDDDVAELVTCCSATCNQGTASSFDVHLCRQLGYCEKGRPQIFDLILYIGIIIAELSFVHYPLGHEAGFRPCSILVGGTSMTDSLYGITLFWSPFFKSIYLSFGFSQRHSRYVRIAHHDAALFHSHSQRLHFPLLIIIFRGSCAPPWTTL